MGDMGASGEPMRLPLRHGVLTLKRADAMFALAAAAALVAIGAAKPAPETATAIALKLAPAPKAFIDTSGASLECAVYARERSGVSIYGNALTWWAQAEGAYRRASAPSEGAVIVMGGTEGGHVGVVAHVIDKSRILIDHANWMGRGEVITNALVEDSSPAGDWSAVRVWNIEADALGGRAYPVLGFVLPERP